MVVFDLYIRHSSNTRVVQTKITLELQLPIVIRARMTLKRIGLPYLMMAFTSGASVLNSCSFPGMEDNYS